MLTFLLLWNDTLLGRIYKEDDNNYRFSPIKEGIEQANQDGLLRGLINANTKEVPPYIINRLKCDPECKNLCQVVTDKLQIIKVAS